MATMTTSDETEKRAQRKKQRRDLLGVLQSPFWFWRTLYVARAVEYFLPWPLSLLHFFYRRVRHGETFKKWRVSIERVHDSFLVTFGVATWLLLARSGVSLDVIEKSYAGDIAKLLFSGAFLLGTILSVSVALPGQSLAKLTLSRTPRFAFDFVVPLLWGFVCGALGALVMMFFPALRSISDDPTVTTALRAAATGISLYGALMVLNAILTTVRNYLVGMIAWSSDIERDEDAKKAAEAAKNAKPQATTSAAPATLPAPSPSAPVETSTTARARVPHAEPAAPHARVAASRDHETSAPEDATGDADEDEDEDDAGRGRRQLKR